jgi:hypothetical protein
MITNKTSLTAIIFSVMVILSIHVHADDLDWFLVYDNSYVQNPNGTIPLSNNGNLRTLSFGTSSERIMKVTYNDDHVDTISTTVIGYIYFGSAPTKVEKVPASTSCISLSGSVLKINADKASVLTVYSIDGRKVLSAKLNTGINSVSIASLYSGMYIARTDKSTLKFCR